MPYSTKEKSREAARQYRLKNKDKCRDYDQQYRDEKRAKIADYRKRYNEKNRIKIRKWNAINSRFRKFGITEDDYNQMFMSQDGKCSICKRHQNDLKRSLAVDHCHRTGRIRGLLCGSCNSAIGYMKDDIIILESAIEYLRSWTNN